MENEDHVESLQIVSYLEDIPGAGRRDYRRYPLSMETLFFQRTVGRGQGAPNSNVTGRGRGLLAFQSANREQGPRAASEGMTPEGNTPTENQPPRKGPYLNPLRPWTSWMTRNPRITQTTRTKRS